MSDDGTGNDPQGGTTEPQQQPKQEPFDPVRAQATILKQREAEAAAKADAKAAREEAKGLAAKLKEYEDKDKSEQQKLQDKLAEVEARALTAEREAQDARVRTAIERSAAKMQFNDPEDAFLQINRAALDFESDGTPKEKSLQDALESLAKAKPYLVGGAPGRGKADQGSRRSSPSGTDMNARIRQSAGRA